MTNSLKLKSYLLLNGRTQEDLSKLLGLSKATTNMKINNHREFKASEIEKICDYFDLSIEERVEIFFARNVDFNSTNIRSL